MALLSRSIPGRIHAIASDDANPQLRTIYALPKCGTAEQFDHMAGDFYRRTDADLDNPPSLLLIIVNGKMTMAIGPGTPLKGMVIQHALPYTVAAAQSPAGRRQIAAATARQWGWVKREDYDSEAFKQPSLHRFLARVEFAVEQHFEGNFVADVLQFAKAELEVSSTIKVFDIAVRGATRFGFTASANLQLFGTEDMEQALNPNDPSNSFWPCRNCPAKKNAESV